METYTKPVRQYVRIIFRSKPEKVYFFNTVTRASSWKMPKKREGKVPDKVKCSHVLVKHTGVRNPKSKRTGKAVERSRKEALDYIKSIEGLLKLDKSSFAEIAKKESDCSSFKRGGNLGHFQAKSMQRAFAKPAFALEVGEMSGIIESPSGFHIILRVE